MKYIPGILSDKVRYIEKINITNMIKVWGEGRL